MGLKRHDSMALLLVLLLPVCTRSTRRLPVAVSPTRTVSLEWPAAAASRASKVLVARAFADRWRLSSGGGCDAPTCVAEALADAMEAAEADEARVVSGARSQAGQDARVLNLRGGPGTSWRRARTTASRTRTWRRSSAIRLARSRVEQGNQNYYADRTPTRLKFDFRTGVEANARSGPAGAGGGDARCPALRSPASPAI